MSDKKTTISELKTFIEAVEFAADVDNWVPSERQWKRIREMINGLTDSGSNSTNTQQYHTTHNVSNIPPSPFVSMPLPSVPPQTFPPDTPHIPIRTPNIDGQYTSPFGT